MEFWKTGAAGACSAQPQGSRSRLLVSRPHQIPLELLEVSVSFWASPKYCREPCSMAAFLWSATGCLEVHSLRIDAAAD